MRLKLEKALNPIDDVVYVLADDGTVVHWLPVSVAKRLYPKFFELRKLNGLD